MTRLSQPPSNIAAKAPRDEDDSIAGPPSGSGLPPTVGRRPGPRLAAFVRWLHLYLSMFGMTSLLFFSLTGITLNHPRFFFDGIATGSEAKGGLNADWVRDGRTASDPGAGVKKLEVVEFLRQAHGLRGALASFTADEDECVVSFKGPGYSANAFIRRGDGRYRVTEERLGVFAVLNDLHKGRDSGPIWSLVIDLSAALTALASMTGLILLFYIKRRRSLGLLTALAGAALITAAFLLGVR